MKQCIQGCLLGFAAMVSVAPSVWAHDSALCVVSLNDQPVSYRHADPGREPNPSYFQGQTRSGAIKKFRVLSQISQDQKTLEVTVFDRTTSEVLASERSAFGPELILDLIYKDLSAEDPIIQVHCKYETGTV